MFKQITQEELLSSKSFFQNPKGKDINLVTFNDIF